MRSKINLLNVVLIATLSLFIGGSAQAQKSKAKAATAPKVDKISDLIKKSGYEYEQFGDRAWTITSTGGHILVGLDATKTIVVVFMTVAENGKFKITADSMVNMLKLSNDLGDTKILIDEKGNLMVRAHALVRFLDKNSFDEMLTSVLEGYEKATSEIAAHMIK